MIYPSLAITVENEAQKYGYFVLFCNTQELSLIHIFSGLEEGKFYEVIKSISLTNHMIGAVWPCINEEIWQSLTPELQKNVLDAFKKGLDANDELALQDEEVLLEKYKAVSYTHLDVYKRQRYTHTPVEACNPEDMEQLARLIREMLGGMDETFRLPRY